MSMVLKSCALALLMISSIACATSCVTGPLVVVNSRGQVQEIVHENQSSDRAESESTNIDKKRRFIIEGISSSDVEQMNTHAGSEIFRQSQLLPFAVATLSPEEARKLQSQYPQSKIYDDIPVKIAEPMEVKLSSFRSPSSTQQIKSWGINEIKADKAHALSKGANITVCVVDTGVQKDHPDLKGSLVGGVNVIHSGSQKPTGENWGDDNGHGTHVAGIIAAEDNEIGVVGVAPQAKIYAVKALDSHGAGSLSDTAEGIMECVKRKAQVINLSFGSPSDPTADSPLKTAINTALAEGIHVVAAAGNSGDKIQSYVPSGYPGVRVVAAIDALRKIPDWSNYGLDVDDFSAPGVAIPSTFINSDYKVLSGTSMAAPHVSGLYALMLAQRKKKISTIDLNLPVSRQGAGMIEAEETLTAGDVLSSNSTPSEVRK